MTAQILPFSRIKPTSDRPLATPAHPGHWPANILRLWAMLATAQADLLDPPTKEPNR